MLLRFDLNRKTFVFFLFVFNQGIKRVYIGSQLIYAIGMLLMGYVKHRIGVIVLSAVAGILYSTLFTIPYLLISKYHTSNTVDFKKTKIFKIIFIFLNK